MLKKLLHVIGIILFIYIIIKIGPLQLFDTIKNADKIYLIIGLILTPIFILPLAFKWYIILKKQNINLNFLYVLKIYYIGAFYGFITPARAGSIIRANYIKQKIKKGFVECASSIVIERILDVLAIFSFAFIGSLLFVKSNTSLSAALIISFLVFLVCILLFMRKKRGMFILSLIYNHILPQSIKEKTNGSLNTFYNSLPRLRNLVVVFFLTIFTWLVLYYQTFIFAKAFYITTIPFYIFVSFVSIGTVISLIPISVSGLGTRELTLITLFSLYNIKPEAIVSTSLVSFFGVGLIEGLIGLFFAVKEDKNEKILNYNTPGS